MNFKKVGPEETSMNQSSHPNHENHIEEINTSLSPTTINDDAPDGAFFAADQ
jgi:hypothetical protein